MATTRKTTAKTAAKKATATAAPAKPVATASKPSGRKITLEERRRMIEEAAYYIAEKSGFSNDSSDNWARAEAQIDAELARKGVTVA